jgi:hypothetical protein
MRSIRRVLPPLVLALLLLAGGYAGYWFYVAAQLRAGLEPWAEARRADGFDIHWDRAAVAGFPGRFRVRLDGAAFKAHEPATYAAAAPILFLDAKPWNLARWHLIAPDGARLSLSGETATFDAARLDGIVALGGAPGTVIHLAARDLAGREDAAGMHIAAVETNVTLPADTGRTAHDTALGVALRIIHLALPRPVPPFGETVEAFSLAATLKGGLPQGPLHQSLAAWRDDGGTIEVQDGSIRWGPLAVDADGTLALDRELQPTGALTARFKNQNAVVDAAVAAGGIRAGDAGLAKAFLGLMAKPGPDGEKRITVPVSVQNERVFLGPAQVAQLPRIAWR